MENEEDIKPYSTATAAPASPQKSNKKPTGEAWTPEQIWALFNAMYKKGEALQSHDPFNSVVYS